MGWFKEAKDTLGSAVGWLSVRKNPLLQSAVVASSLTWEKLQILHQLSEKGQERLRMELLQKVNGIAASANQVMACRSELVFAARQFGAHHVLLCDPPPSEDGLRLIGLPGISGKLRPYLREVIQKSEQMREWAHGTFDTPPSEGDLFETLRASRAMTYWYCMTFNAMRNELNDCNPVKERDWFRPLLWATSAAWECMYWADIGREPDPSVDPLGLKMRAITYNSFAEIVLQGHRYPDLKWREAYAQSLADGSLPAPDFAGLHLA